MAAQGLGRERLPADATVGLSRAADICLRLLLLAHVMLRLPLGNVSACCCIFKDATASSKLIKQLPISLCQSRLISNNLQSQSMGQELCRIKTALKSGQHTGAFLQARLQGARLYSKGVIAGTIRQMYPRIA